MHPGSLDFPPLGFSPGLLTFQGFNGKRRQEKDLPNNAALSLAALCEHAMRLG